MAVLASVEDVQLLMNDTTLSDEYVSSILVTADLVLTKVFEYDNTLSTGLLAELQKYYAAHLIASTTARMATEEKVGDASISYAGKFSDGLKSTPYGQLLLLIDPTGLIARGGKISASITAVKSFNR